MTDLVDAADFTAGDFQKATGVSRETLQKLEDYAALIPEWQRRLNLVSPRSIPEIWHRHLLDSAQLVPLAEKIRNDRGRPLVWLDIGSGAGFPALVIAIMTGEEVHLVEKSPKKCGFLRAVAERLAPNAHVHNCRVEDLASSPNGPAVDVVTARACAPLPRLLEMAYPFLSKGATGLFLKGQHLEEELTQTAKCWRITHKLHQSLTSPGGRILRVEEVSRV